MVEYKIINWLKNNKLIAGIVFLSLFLRLFRISSYMTFLGDEGRDALVWLRMVNNFKFTLIGPQTSIGNMYLGPLYYYLMLPFYILLGTSGPSIGTALFAGGTTFLLWLFGREWFSQKVGLIAAFLYAISPVAIILSHSSWNPNVMPFFALLIIWGVWQFWQKEKYYWLAIDGILLSFAIQSHYLGLLLIPVISFFVLIKLLTVKLVKLQDIDKITRSCKNVNSQKGNDAKKLFFYCFFGLLFFLLLTVVPLIWFDLRHNFINYKSFYKFFSERQTTVNLKPYKAIPQMWPLWQMLVTRLLAGKNVFFGLWISLTVAFSGVYFLIKNRLKKTKVKPAVVLLLAWILIGLLGMGLYKQHIYDHYFGFLFPAVFLLFALILERVWFEPYFGKVSATILFLAVATLSLREIPLKSQPGFQMKRTVEVCEKIQEESGGQPFNLGMIAKQNYDAGYRYFLEKWGGKAAEIDPQKSKETVAEQLFVVCEIDQCQPTSHPQAEIANFGWSKIEKEWSFPWGTKLFKLVHYSK